MAQVLEYGVPVIVPVFVVTPMLLLFEQVTEGLREYVPRAVGRWIDDGEEVSRMRVNLQG